ncbi:alpha/beta hydrolase [Actinocorallia longicatena]|uniref:Alpha/beta hydrolase n=1 Tax=Actinocorallia longicatena TaxID=111803 RepID=A0ABP6QJD7_9ACTN
MKFTHSTSRRLRLGGLVTGLTLVTASLSMSATAADAGSKPGVKPTIVLVHGAWADTSGWNDVIEGLRRDGYPAVAFANPLRGLEGDAAYLDATIAGIEGPIVLVGHSYGGSVITETSPDPDVKALVYVSAFLPEQGESAFGISGRFPGSLITPEAIRVVPLPSGDADIYLQPASLGPIFGLPASTARLLSATQRPVTQGALGGALTGTPAWKRLPTWTLISKTDKAIPLEAQRFMTARAHSRTVELNAGHAAFLTHPGAVTAVIERAAATR